MENIDAIVSSKNVLIERVKNTDNYNGLLDFIDFLKNEKKFNNINFLELGSFSGESTEIFADSGMCSTLTAVDSWTPGYDNTDISASQNMKDVESIFDLRMKRFNFIQKYKEKSSKFLMNCNKIFDLVYIDANHQFEYVLSDLFLSKKCVKYISGHDYDWSGVRDALRVFYNISDNNFPIKLFRDNTWFIDIKNF